MMYEAEIEIDRFQGAWQVALRPFGPLTFKLRIIDEDNEGDEEDPLDQKMIKIVDVYPVVADGVDLSQININFPTDFQPDEVEFSIGGIWNVDIFTDNVLRHIKRGSSDRWPDGDLTEGSSFLGLDPAERQLVYFLPQVHPELISWVVEFYIVEEGEINNDEETFQLYSLSFGPQTVYNNYDGLIQIFLQFT